MTRIDAEGKSMKIILLMVMLGGLCGSAVASDKDILRDACSALKTSAKRSECFEAIDHISAAQSKTPAENLVEPSQKLTVNPRALQCEHFEFSEIDSFSKNDLESAICSFDAGDRIASSVGEASVAKQSDPSVKVALLRRQLAHTEQCHSERTKALDVFRRKFGGGMPDCLKMPGKFAPPSATKAEQPTGTPSASQ